MYAKKKVVRNLESVKKKKKFDEIETFLITRDETDKSTFNA